MKKVLSSILALVMLISTFAISSTSAYARAKGSKVELGTTQLSITKNSGVTVNFTPDADGMYEFGIDIKIKEDSQLVLINVMDADANKYKDDYVAYKTYVDNKTAIAAAGQLQVGKTYNIEIMISGYTYPQTFNLTVSKHKHSMVKEYSPAYYARSVINDEIFVMKSDGYDYSCCTVCDYKVKGKEVYKPYSNGKISKTTYTYDGKAKKPKVTVTNAKGEKYPSSQYDLSYSSNKKVGYGYASVHTKESGVNPRYYVWATYRFKINPKGTSIKSVSAAKKGLTVKYKKQTTQTTGYQIQYATDKNFKKNKKTVTVKKNKTTSVKVKKLKAKKKYYVRVRTYKNVKDADGNAKKLYSSWSKTKTVKTKK